MTVTGKIQKFKMREAMKTVHETAASRRRKRHARMSKTRNDKLNARSAEFQANATAMRALVDDLHAQFAKVEAGGGEAARSKHTARGKLLPRDRVAQLLDPGTPFLEVAPLAAHAMYHGAAPGAGPDRRHRPRERRRLHDRVQRRDGEGRHLLSRDGQEAPARAGDRRAEPPALHLPGRFGRRQPAEPGRGVPRPRPLRPHLLQPGQHERRRASRRSPWSWARARPAAPTCRR